MTTDPTSCDRCGGRLPTHNAWCDVLRPRLDPAPVAPSAPCPVCEAAHRLTLSGDQSDAESLIKAAIVNERKSKESAEAERDRLAAENARLLDNLRAWRDPVCVALRTMIERISEENWCAGWHDGIDHGIWRDVVTGSSDEVHDPSDRESLRSLSQIIGGWIQWPDEKDAEGPAFVALDDWVAIHAEWFRDRAALREGGG